MWISIKIDISESGWCYFGNIFVNFHQNWYIRICQNIHSCLLLLWFSHAVCCLVAEAGRCRRPPRDHDRPAATLQMNVAVDAQAWGGVLVTLTPLHTATPRHIGAATSATAPRKVKGSVHLMLPPCGSSHGFETVRQYVLFAWIWPLCLSVVGTLSVNKIQHACFSEEWCFFGIWPWSRNHIPQRTDLFKQN